MKKLSIALLATAMIAAPVITAAGSSDTGGDVVSCDDDGYEYEETTIQYTDDADFWGQVDTYVGNDGDWEFDSWAKVQGDSLVFGEYLAFVHNMDGDVIYTETDDSHKKKVKKKKKKKNGGENPC